MRARLIHSLTVAACLLAIPTGSQAAGSQAAESQAAESQAAGSRATWAQQPQAQATQISPDDHAPDPSPPEFSAQRLSDHIKYLADDALEGRFPGKVGEPLTLAYLQAQYEALGLEPGGPSGQWLQTVDLLRLTPTRPATISWTGPDHVAHPITSGLQVRAGAASSHVALKDVPVVFAGYGVVAPERHWDDYGDMDLTGKVVIVLGGQPAVFGVDPDFYGSPSHKTQEALKRGAVGVITLYDTPGRRLWGDTRPRMTIVGSHETAFSGSMTLEVATPMASATHNDITALIARARAGDFKARDTGTTLSVDIDESTEAIQSHNLLARIPGSTRPNETVIYSAHWDHIGVAADADANGDRIYNGAWDNASGTAGLIEMARAFKAGSPPERSVVFLHVTAEEQGLLGSEWYANHPVYPVETTAADINIDMLPFTPATRTIAVFGLGKSSLEDDLGRLAAREGRTVVGDGEPEQGYYYRSDHFNFAIAGVPALMPWTGVDFVEGGEAVGRPAYQWEMRQYYHQRDDEWRADYDFAGAIQNLRLLYDLGHDVADSPDWPQWKPTAEFAAVRHLSDGARQ
ncbi:M28 family metallopeptidase [soil metagenome]